MIMEEKMNSDTDVEFIQTALEGVYVVQPKFRGDYRGWFCETWSKREFEAAGLFYDFVQDNHSYSAKKGTLRGLHFQRGEFSQAKYVRCVRGAIRDVVVDLRHESPTYLKWHAEDLSEENRKALVVPRGFAHGFISLTDDVEFLYRVDNYYNPESEASIRYDDPQFAIDWGIGKDFEPIMAKKDMEAPYFCEYGILF